MNLCRFKGSQKEEVIALFRTVFSDSEGENEGKLIADLVSELIETTEVLDLIGFVAESRGEIIASIFFSRITLSCEKYAMILSPVAVLTSKQRKGIGKKLIQFGVEKLKEEGIEFLFSYGDPQYYSKLGFEQIREDLVKAPLKLSFPMGWIAQSIGSTPLSALRGNNAQCVDALNKQIYW